MGPPLKVPFPPFLRPSFLSLCPDISLAFSAKAPPETFAVDSNATKVQVTLSLTNRGWLAPREDPKKTITFSEMSVCHDGKEEWDVPTDKTFVAMRPWNVLLFDSGAYSTVNLISPNCTTSLVS